MERKARMIIQPIDSPAGAAMSPSARSSILPHLALMLSMLVWSSTFIGLKIALSAYSPASAMALRMGSAALLCLPLLPRLLRAMKHPAVRRVLLFGVLCEPCLYFLCETSALRHTSSAQAGMVLALLPLTAAAGARLFLGENMEGRAWLGFALALFGVIWISCGGEVSESSPAPLLGNALEALAVLCATGYTLCMRKLSAVLPPLLLTAAMTFAGTLFFSALSLLPFSAEPVRLAVTVPDWMPAAAILYLGIAATFGGYGLYNYGSLHQSDPGHHAVHGRVLSQRAYDSGPVPRLCAGRGRSHAQSERTRPAGGTCPCLICMTLRLPVLACC